MSWLTKILGGGAGQILKGVGSIIDKFNLSPTEKKEFELEFERLLQQRDSEIEETIRAELGAKERILVAELTQGDRYTKRARPTVIYAGLGFIFFNYCVIPLIQTVAGVTVAPFKLPTEFWVGWSGIVATYSIGRSAEKRGATSRLQQLTTAETSERPSLLD